MSVLSDYSILKSGLTPPLVEPMDVKDVQPASVDLHLDHHFMRAKPFNTLDPLRDLSGLYHEWETKEPFAVRPSWFFLGATVERISLPANIRGRVEGKSSLARLGLIVHVTGGFIDPGFEGPITLEICNLSDNAIVLTPGMKICQIEFTYLTTVALRPYGSEGLGSKYTNNPDGPVGSKMHEEGS